MHYFALKGMPANAPGRYAQTAILRQLLPALGVSNIVSGGHAFALRGQPYQFVQNGILYISSREQALLPKQVQHTGMVGMLNKAAPLAMGILPGMLAEVGHHLAVAVHIALQHEGYPEIVVGRITQCLLPDAGSGYGRLAKDGHAAIAEIAVPQHVLPDKLLAS